MISAATLLLLQAGTPMATAMPEADIARDAAEIAAPIDPEPAPVPIKVSLPVGTDIKMHLLDELSTKRTAKGETFQLVVTEDVQANGWLLVPSGTIAVGEVTRSDAKGAWGKSGKLEARVLYLRLNDRPVRLTGGLVAAGEGGTTEAVLATIAGGMLGFAVTGKSAVIPEGTPLIATTDRSTMLTPLAATGAQ